MTKPDSNKPSRRKFLPMASNFHITIRARLLVAYIGIILLGFSGLTFIAGNQITTAGRADYAQHLQDQVRLVAQGMGNALNGDDPDSLNPVDAQNLVKGFESQVEGKLTLYLPRGILTSTSYQPNDTDNDTNNKPPSDPITGAPNTAKRPDALFNTMPELETAIHNGVILVERDDSAGIRTFYTAAQLTYNGHPITGLVQYAVPTQILQGVVLQRWAVLGFGFVLLTTLALIAALILSRSIIQPLYKLRDSAVRLSQGDLSYRISMTRRDEISEVANAFNHMAQQVQSMLEEQRAFASNASHELRTPLTAIRLRTEALRHDPTLEETVFEQYVREIDEEVTHLGHLVEDLTLLSRFDAGRAELGKAEVDVNRLASNLVQQISGLAGERQIELCIVPAADPALVTASLNHLNVVFRNILDNAVKYTPGSGKITWRIQCENDGVTSIIQDTGRGIAAQHLPHVFDRFYRADKSHSRDIPGTGLGLSLVKSIVEAYGGRVSLESAGLGHGVQVTIFWPTK